MKNGNRVEKEMTEYPKIANSSMTVTEAALFMKECGFRHLPVVEHNKVVGVVSERDLCRYQDLSEHMDLLVADVMTPDPYCVKVGTPLSTVAKEMAAHKYGCAIVLNDWGRVVGIFTTTDGMRILSELMGSDPTPEFKLFGIEKLLSPGYIM